MKWSKLVQIVLMGIFLLIGTLVNSTMAQLRPLTLSDAQQPGSVIVFPKFIRGFVPVDGVSTPRTEFEIGVVCPPGVPPGSAACAPLTRVRIHFHWVCGNDLNPANSYLCRESDFFASTTINGKLVFNTEGINPGNFLVPFTPPCERGYLIGWVVNSSNQPIKFDGLIGDAVLRESGTAVASYNAIPIQAAPALAINALVPLAPGGGLPFNGISYQAVSGVIYADVAYEKFTSPFRRTFLTLLTLDVLSSRPNYPTFVDLDFYNAFEVAFSNFTQFVCWQEVQLSDIDLNLTSATLRSRKGIVITSPAVKVPIGGVADTPGPVTLLGLVEVLEGPITGDERLYTQGVSNDSIPIPTVFFPN
jgi:hypothetical protein